MNNIKISFVVPTYNASKYVYECIESILKINSNTIEVIVVDDGSTDDTVNILEEIIDDRLFVIKQENQGVSVARNNGIAKAKGMYIAFVDADDKIDHLKYQECMSVIDYNKDVYMFRYKEMIGEEMREISLPIKPGVYGKKEAKELGMRLHDSRFSTNYEAMYFGGKVFQYLFERSFLEKYSILFPDTVRFAEDCIFCMTCFMHIEKFEVMDRSMYFYRVVENSASHMYRERLWDELTYSFQTGCKIAQEQLKYKNENYFFFGHQVIEKVLRRYPRISQKKNACKEITKQLEEEEFQSALRNLSWNKWSLKERLLINLFKFKNVECIYWFFRIKNETKRLIGR